MDPSGALGAAGASGGFAGAASLLSGLLAGAKPAPASKGGATMINIPGLGGTAGGASPSMESFNVQSNKKDQLGERGTPVLLYLRFFIAPIRFMI